MNIALVGFDTEGRATYEYFRKHGNHTITICDQNTELAVPSGVPSVLGSTYLDNLDRFDLIVRTPGIHPSKILEKNPTIADKITTQTNIFFENCPTGNIIGVTGTKGKGTTSTLITKIVEANGKTVRLGGNIGVPPLTFIDELKQDSWVVLELSSFQLIDLKYSPHIAVCLMVVPEHLNWHDEMAEYTTAKEQLFAHQQIDDIAVYYAGNDTSYQIASAGLGQMVPYYEGPGAIVENGLISIEEESICKVEDLKLIGAHNWQNVCAAITAVRQAGFTDSEPIRRVVTTFSGLPHRLELVRSIHDVRFYNDSFASGLHATEAAIMAIDGKKVMILGGFDRMIDLDHFGTFAMQHSDQFRTLLLIGQSAERLAGVLQTAGFTNFVIDTEAQTMEAIVKHAFELAQAGDAVVLSPGFASFDLFKNFEDRGDQFRAVVKGL